MSDDKNITAQNSPPPPPLHSSGIVVRTLAFDQYAYSLLREMAPSTKGYGQLLSALILAEYARRQERLLQRRGISQMPLGILQENHTP